MKHQAKALAVITTWTIYRDVFSQEGVCALDCPRTDSLEAYSLHADHT